MQREAWNNNSMVYISLATWLLYLGLCLYGFRGGSSLMLLASLLTVASGLLAMAAQPLLAKFIVEPADQALYQLIIFLVLLCLVMPSANFLNRFFYFGLDPFDWTVGTLGGMVTGSIAVFFLLSYLLASTVGSPMHATLKKSYVVRQFVYHETWHNLERAVLGLTEKVERDQPEL